ncbi:MAG TPA: hypothetical protein PLW44_01210 [Chitinophagales bacterium]|nr:hypothetical protein [Chitinophagales bacterium]
MKQTIELVSATAVTVLNDIGWKFDAGTAPTVWYTSIEDQYELYKNFEGFEEKKDKIFAFWTVSFDFPLDDNWKGRNAIFVLIKDEDGVPYEVSNKQYTGKIIKTDEGMYQNVDMPRK